MYIFYLLANIGKFLTEVFNRNIQNFEIYDLLFLQITSKTIYKKSQLPTLFSNDEKILNYRVSILKWLDRCIIHQDSKSCAHSERVPGGKR